MGDGRRDPKEMTRQRIQKNGIQYQAHPTNMERKREDLKKKTSAKKQISRKYPKANYHFDRRTIRTAYSRNNVS
jgi:hypothetical protein